MRLEVKKYNIYINSKDGYVYILTNPSILDYVKIVKIGFTKDLKRRLNDLDTTGVAMPFEPYCIIETS